MGKKLDKYSDQIIFGEKTKLRKLEKRDLEKSLI